MGFGSLGSKLDRSFEFRKRLFCITLILEIQAPNIVDGRLAGLQSRGVLQGGQGLREVALFD